MKLKKYLTLAQVLAIILCCIRPAIANRLSATSLKSPVKDIASSQHFEIQDPKSNQNSLLQDETNSIFDEISKFTTTTYPHADNPNTQRCNNIIIGLSIAFIVVALWYIAEQTVLFLLTCFLKCKIDCSMRQELASRIVETAGLMIIIISGVSIVCLYIQTKSSTAFDKVPGALLHAAIMCGFQIYHFLRIINNKGYPQTLLIHHALLFLGIIYVFVVDMLFFYPAIVSLQSASGVLRNYVWLSKHFQKTFHRLPKQIIQWGFIILESVLPVCYLVYFLGWEVRQHTMPWHVWGFGFVISMGLMALLLYFTFKVIKHRKKQTISSNKINPAQASAPDALEVKVSGALEAKRSGQLEDKLSNSNDKFYVTLNIHRIEECPGESQNCRSAQFPIQACSSMENVYQQIMQNVNPN